MTSVPSSRRASVAAGSRLSVLSLSLGAAFAAQAQSGDATLLALALPAELQVVITATRTPQPLSELVADMSVIDRETIERSGATGVADLLARLPGIEIARNGGVGGTSSVYLRGAESRFTAVYIDGVRVDSQATGGATWEQIPLAQIDHIEVLRGPAAAVYGSDAIGGVVQLFTRKGQGKPAPVLSVGLGNQGLRSAQASVSGGAAAIDYALGLASERSSGFNTKTAASANPDRDGYRSASANARLGLQLDPRQRLEATLLVSNLNAQYDGYGAITDDDRSHYRLRTVGLGWQSKWSEAYGTLLQVTESRSFYATAPSVYQTETRLRNYLVQSNWRIGAHRLTAAVERREDALDNASTTPASTQRAQSGLALGYGVSAGGHTLQANLRHDRDSEFGGKTTGSAAYGYGFAPNWRATASAGTAFRAPTLFQRFSIYGVPTLTPEVSHNMELGLKYTLQASSFSAVVYRNKVDGLISYVSGAGSCANGSGDYAGCYGNTQHARYQGLTLSGAHTVGRLSLNASLDVQDPRDLDTGKRLARRARQHATLGADTELSGWTLGADAQWSAERFDDVANTVRLGGYGLLSLNASRALTRELTLSVRVDNLADKHYQLANGYATAGRQVYLGLKWAPL